MADTATRHVLTEAIWPAEGAELWVEAAVLVVARHRRAGDRRQDQRAGLAVAGADQPRHLRGADHRRRLRPAARARDHPRLPRRSARSASTSSPAPRPRSNGLAYMLGGTGGYLVGYLLATLALGFAARRGWDRSVGGMALAMLVGNVLIYVPGAALAEPPDRRRPVRPGEVRLALGADAGLGPDALPDRRRDQARARRAGRAGPLEAGRQRPRLTRRVRRHACMMSGKPLR